MNTESTSIENPSSSKSNPQDVNVVRESNGVEFTPAHGQDSENVSIPADASVPPATSFDASPLDSLNHEQPSISSADVYRPSYSPPPLSGSPVDYSHTPHPAAIAGTHNQFSDDQPSVDPYAPDKHSRQNSDMSFTGSINSSTRAISPKHWDPYAPPKPTTQFRKNSNASSLHSTYDRTSLTGISETTQVSYAQPSGLPRAQSRQSQRSYDDNYTSRYNYTHEPDLETIEGQSNLTIDSNAGVYSNVSTAPTYAPYAPSPSLLGTNDPLGRASARVPVISFGFAGRFVTCFHSAGETASGFDVSLTSRQTTSVQLRTLHEVIPASAIDSSASSYPGPLFSDPGTSTISIVRTVGVGNSTNIKAKKALVLGWLGERAEELSSGVAHLPSGSQERYNAEGKLVLVRLLKAMVDSDGQLSGR